MGEKGRFLERIAAIKHEDLNKGKVETRRLKDERLPSA
jgi:hypothetical protein